ncbi:MAG: hypothetical protein QUS12_06585 [Methanosarcina sp.]|nr:hypothetical protein [Methanosarcina sp.]
MGYSLAILSVLFMLYSAYNLAISGKAPSVIYIHGLFGAISLAAGFIFVINRWRWKTRRNMRILLALWLLTFSGGILIYLAFTGKLP